MATKYAEFGSTPLASDRVTPEDLAASQPNEFVRGARAGTYGMGSSLRNAAGAAADAFDFDGFAAQQYAEADRLAQRAQETGPRVGSLEQLGREGYSLRNVGDFAAGVIGGAAPSIGVGVGASLATGGAFIPSMLAGTAAFTPFEAGDAVAKWRAANPGQQIDGQTALRLAGTGVGSATFQSAAPAVVGGKIMGRGMASAPSTSLRQAVGRNLAEIPLEGATEGAGELIKQTGATPELATDWGAVGEGFVGGVIGGAPMAGLGAVGDYAHGNAQAIGGAVDKGIGAVRGATQRATGAAQGAADTAGPVVRDTWDGVADMAKAAYDGTVEGFKASDLGKTLGERAGTARDWATEIIEDPTTPENIREGLRAAATNAGNKVNQAYVWAAKQAHDAQNMMTRQKDEADTEGDTPSGVLRGLRTKIDDTVDRVLNDDFLGDAAEMAKATGDRVTELSQQSMQKGAEFATKWGNELLDRAGVSEETKAKVAEALRNVGDRTSQTTIAAAKKAADAAEGVRARAKAFADGIKKGMRDRARADVDVEAREVPDSAGALGNQQGRLTGPKKSEDYSGARKAVNDVLAKYRQELPEAVLDDPETSTMLADGLREFVKIAARPGAFDTIDKHWVRAQLGGLLGPRSTDILNEVWDAVGSSEPDAVARRYQTLNDLDDMNKQAMSLTTVLQAALPEGSPLAARQAEDADVLTRWARGELTKKMSPEQAKFEDRRMQEYIQETYGDKAETVLAALERQATMSRDMKMDKVPDQDGKIDADEVDDDDVVDQFGVGIGLRDADADGGPDIRYIGLGAGKRLVTNPEVYRAQDKTGKPGSGDNLLENLKERYPQADIRFVSVVEKPELIEMIPEVKEEMTKLKGELAEQFPNDPARQAKELEQARLAKVDELRVSGKGMFEIVNNPNEYRFTQADIEAMRLDTKRFGRKDHPSRLEAPDGPIFDAVAVARVMRGKINRNRDWAIEDDRSDAHRLARAFNDGVAALMEEFGRFKVSPDTLIGTINDKPFYARDIKGLKKDAGQNFRDLRDGESDAPGTKRAPGDRKIQIRREANAEDLKSAAELQSELDDVSMAIQSLEAEAEDGGDPQTLIRLYDREAKLTERLEQASMAENAEAAAEAIGQQNVDPVNDSITKAGAALDKNRPMFARADRKGKKSGQQLRGKASLADITRRDLAREAQPGTANGKTPNVKPLLALAERIRETNAPAREKIADRLQTLVLNIAMMSRKDQERLLDLTVDLKKDWGRGTETPVKVSEVSSTINDLARKYADKIVAPKGADVSGSEVLSREKTPERGAMSNARAATARERNKDGVFGEKVMTDAELRARISSVKKSTAERVGALKAADKDIDFLRKLDPAIRKSEGKDLVDPELAVLERELASRAEGQPRPKAVAAKKAAFLKKAASGDAALIKELKASNDAKGLQRAVETLNAVELTDANEANIVAAVEAINDRLAQLMQDPDVAYGMGTKKYSLMGAERRTGYPVTFRSEDGVGSIVGKLGPFKNAAVFGVRDEDGANLYVADITVSDEPALTYELFRNESGQWEVGVDGPQPGTKPFDSFRSMFDVVEYREGDGGVTTYSKFKPGSFNTGESRALLRTLRDYAAELGVRATDVAFGRETGVQAGRPQKTVGAESVKKFSLLSTQVHNDLQREFDDELTALLAERGINVTREAVAHVPPELRVSLMSRAMKVDPGAPMSQEVAKFVSWMTVGSDFFQQIDGGIRGTELEKRVLAAVNRDARQSMYSAPRKRREVVRRVVEQLLTTGLNKEYARRAPLSAKVLQVVRDAVRAVMEQLGGVKYKELQGIADRYVSGLLDGSIRLEREKKPGSALLDPYHAFSGDRNAADITYALASGREFALTGSLAYAAQGTVYRSEGAPIHDLDFVTSLNQQAAEGRIEKLIPRAQKVRSFGGLGDFVSTYVVAPKDHRVDLIRVDSGVVTSFVVRDKAGRVVGRYSNVDGVESSSGAKAAIIDLIHDPKVAEHTMTIPTSMGDRQVKIADVRDAMAQKLLYARDKDIVDFANFVPKNTVHFSAQKAAGAGMSAKGQQQVMDAINTMLGKSVKVEFKNLPHAGEFESVKGVQMVGNKAFPTVDDVIRISIHALNPTTVAYHESLHAFFAKLMRTGSGDVADVLMRATQRPAVNKRLRELLAGEPAALKQLRDPEERAAYMFQFWANGDAQLIAALKGEPQTFLQRIADTLRKVLGIWSNEERALHIMEAFSSGEYAQNLGTPSAFRRAMMEPGRNKALEGARSLTKPFLELGEVVVAAGSARLRESRIPSLVELADVIKAPLTEEAVDPGFLPAARLERTRVLNELGAKLEGLSKDTISEALDILQTGSTQNTTPEARLAAREVKKVLANQLTYLRAAGVDVGNLGPDYFPRVYDTTYISKHQDEFQAVLDKHGIQGDTMHKIIANGGTELGVEVDRPGMQAKKKRSLAAIPDAELAPFMQKDLYQILNSYVAQSTRRAEWARRFGDDSSRLHDLLGKAKKEGATPAQLEAAEKYVKGVNGTLGDDINPTARRLMGDMIVYQNIRLLPLAIFSSVVDPMGVLVRGGEVKDAWNTFKRGIREIPKGLRGDTSLDESARIADALGVIDNAALVHDLGALYSQGMVGNTARKINDGFFRFNLMEQFNRSMRVGATEAALKFMERHSTGNASAHSARWMRELGLMRGDVKNVGGRVALTQADGLTPAQEARIRTAVNRWVDGAVLRPDAADKPIWMNDPHWALVAHLKQFVYAFHHTILKRVGHEMRNGNYAPAMALASYVPIMIAADAAKGMLQNGGDEPEWKKNWDLEDYVAHGVQRAGLLGVGQLGVDAYTDVQRGGTGVGALAGPTLEQVGDALQVLGGHKQFESFALRAMPANALYSGYLDEERADLSTD